MRRYGWVVVVAALLALWSWQQRAPVVRSPAPPVATAGDASREGLPPEARDTLRQIASGGPFAHRQDGAVFQNREHRLPLQPSGYYHEYTVDTPGARDRGARRIVTGGDPPVEYFYSGDHYRSFRRVSSAEAR